MILKVADSVKGSLVIPGVHGTFKKNTEVELSEEQLKNTEIQSMIRMGLLEGSNIPVTQFFTEYKNISGYILNFSWGQHVRPKQAFFIDNIHLGCEELKNFVKDGLISRVIVEKQKKVAKSPKTKTAEKAKPASVATKKSNIKIQTKVDIKTAAKDPQTLKDVLTKQADSMSENVHIHEPKQTMPQVKTDAKGIIDADVAEEKETIQFVDKLQKKEKITKLQKIIQEKNAASKNQ